LDLLTTVNEKIKFESDFLIFLDFIV